MQQKNILKENQQTTGNKSLKQNVNKTILDKDNSEYETDFETEFLSFESNTNEKSEKWKCRMYVI